MANRRNREHGGMLALAGEYQLGEVSVRPAWLPSYSWDVPYGYWQDGRVFGWIRHQEQLHKNSQFHLISIC